MDFIHAGICPIGILYIKTKTVLSTHKSPFPENNSCIQQKEISPYSHYIHLQISHTTAFIPAQKSNLTNSMVSHYPLNTLHYF
jgi:hypothetical protein